MVSAVQIHLLLNHVPLFFSLVAALLLFAALIFKSSDLRYAAYAFFILGALVALLVYKSGHQAEHIAKNYPGMIRSLMKDHERSAFGAMILVESVGFLSLVLCFLKNSRVQALGSWFLLAVSLALILFMARASHLGGLIRHEEIRTIEPSLNG